MEVKLTMQIIENAVAALKEHQVKGDYILRIHPTRAQEAFDLGFAPFCSLTDDKFIGAEYSTQTR